MIHLIKNLLKLNSTHLYTLNFIISFKIMKESSSKIALTFNHLSILSLKSRLLDSSTVKLQYSFLKSTSSTLIPSILKKLKNSSKNLRRKFSSFPSKTQAMKMFKFIGNSKITKFFGHKFKKKFQNLSLIFWHRQ